MTGWQWVLLHTWVWSLVWLGWPMVAWGILHRPLNKAGAAVGWWFARRAHRRAARKRSLAYAHQCDCCRAPMPEIPLGILAERRWMRQMDAHYQAVASLTGAGAITARPVVTSWYDGDQR